MLVTAGVDGLPKPLARVVRTRAAALESFAARLPERLDEFDRWAGRERWTSGQGFVTAPRTEDHRAINEALIGLGQLPRHHYPDLLALAVCRADARALGLPQAAVLRIAEPIATGRHAFTIEIPASEAAIAALSEQVRTASKAALRERLPEPWAWSRSTVDLVVAADEWVATRLQGVSAYALAHQNEAGERAISLATTIRARSKVAARWLSVDGWSLTLALAPIGSEFAITN